MHLLLSTSNISLSFLNLPIRKRTLFKHIMHSLPRRVIDVEQTSRHTKEVTYYETPS